MKESSTNTTIANLQESIDQFFFYHEKAKNLQSSLASFEAEMFLCEQLRKALSKIERSPC